MQRFSQKDKLSVINWTVKKKGNFVQNTLHDVQGALTKACDYDYSETSQKLDHYLDRSILTLLLLRKYSI